MKIFLHDNKPAQGDEPHGFRGPTHCGTTTVDYEYQAEQLVIDVAEDYPHVVRIECPELGREWRRDGRSKFVEVPKPATDPYEITRGRGA